jgi:hypothetical protein
MEYRSARKGGLIVGYVWHKGNWKSRKPRRRAALLDTAAVA